MKSHHFLAYCLTSPWAMWPDAMRTHAALLMRGYLQRDGIKAAGKNDYGTPTEPEAAAARASGRQGSIQMIPVYGTIVQRASQLGPCEGGTSTQSISNALRDALADETVSQILLDIDSPGGSVFGVGELADEIVAARKQKPVVAIANSMAASAAYWLGCSASEFYMTPGGQVGSIGVWMAHQDISKALEAEGVDIKLISAGKYKVEGNPYMPLDEEGQAFMQSSVDDYYSAFTRAVARGRAVPIDTVRNGMGQGRVLGADAALAENMVDGVMPFSDVVKKMARAGQAARGKSARAQARAEMEMMS